ncbi:MAG TPA: tryptophan synthase subunit alpha [Bacteroidia bacterium]|jgi:tryptophan synthase alpha chain|nr:tryptophan synthase subunit alpha [Bacteroidia bacterium]
MSKAFQLVFKKAKENNKPAFMPFLVAGDPDYKSSLDLFRAIAPYADMLEIGFPYSDPLADGPTIQAADERALHSGINTDKVFSLISEIRSFYKGPISVLVYANLVYQFGLDNFYKQAAKSGIDGVLVPDVPYEESEPFVLAAKKHKVSPVFMVTQTTTPERLKKILQYAEGYLYLVSVLGVTGSRNSLGKTTFDFIKKIKKNTSLPLALGFGISTKEHIGNAAKAGIDGVIVGSAIIKILEANLANPNQAAKKIEAFIETLL